MPMMPNLCRSLELPKAAKRTRAGNKQRWHFAEGASLNIASSLRKEIASYQDRPLIWTTILGVAVPQMSDFNA